MTNSSSSRQQRGTEAIGPRQEGERERDSGGRVDGACALTANMYRSPTRKSAGCVQPDAAATQSAASTSAAWCTTVTSVISIAVRSTAADNLFLPLVPGPGTHSVPATALSVCLVSQDGRKRNTVRTLCMSGPDACVEEGELNRRGRGAREAKSRAHRGQEAAVSGERKGGRMHAGPTREPMWAWARAAVVSCVPSLALSHGLTRRPHPEQRMWELSSPTARSAGLFGSVMGGGQMMRNTSTSVYISIRAGCVARQRTAGERGS